MKKLVFSLFVFGIMLKAYSQAGNNDLPAEFRNVAAQAFQKLGPQTKQWFIDAANQHPAGSFDSTWTYKKLRERFSTNEMDLSGSLFAVMMEYQRMMNKEAREDRRLQRQDQRMELAAKEEKLKTDNKSIDQGMKEAKEKADNAMTAAQTNMWIGIVSGSAAIGSNTAVSSSSRLNPKIQPKDSSNKLNVQASQREMKVKQAQQQADKAGEEKKASEDHNQRIKDAVKKLLDQVAAMKANL